MKKWKNNGGNNQESFFHESNHEQSLSTVYDLYHLIVFSRMNVENFVEKLERVVREKEEMTKKIVRDKKRKLQW